MHACTEQLIAKTCTNIFSLLVVPIRYAQRRIVYNRARALKGRKLNRIQQL